MIDETGTLGVRQQFWKRLTLSREVQSVSVQISGKAFEVRIKVARDESGNIVRVKPEFDDIRAIAKDVGLPARGVEEIVSVQVSSKYQEVE